MPIAYIFGRIPDLIWKVITNAFPLECYLRFIVLWKKMLNENSSCIFIDIGLVDQKSQPQLHLSLSYCDKYLQYLLKALA